MAPTSDVLVLFHQRAHISIQCTFTPSLILRGLKKLPRGLKKKQLLSVDECSHSHLNAGEALGERIIHTRSLHLNNSAYESINTTRLFHPTRNELLSPA